MSNNRIYINSALLFFEYKDKRSFKRWCQNNGVPLLRDIGTKKLYVNKESFFMAKIRTEKFEIPNEIRNNDNKLKIKNGYSPISKYEEECLSRLLLGKKCVI